jgi:DNA repair exonuclease SbcCD ATPase subunit
VDREYREKVEAVAKLKTRLTEAEKEARKADSELADLKEKAEEVPDAAAERSIVAGVLRGSERDRRGRTGHPDDRGPPLGLEEEIESARGELSTREESLPTETEQHEERLKDWRTAQRTINEEVAAAETEIQKPKRRFLRGTGRNSIACSTRSAASRSRASSRSRTPTPAPPAT